MKTYLKKLFREASEKMHESILEWLDDPEYRAELFVEDYIDQLISELEKKNLSQKEFANKAGVSKPAITQLLKADENISVKRMFKYADILDLTIEHPKLLAKDFGSFYDEYIKTEIENDFVLDVEKQKKNIKEDEILEDLDSYSDEEENKHKSSYSCNFYKIHKAI